MSTKNIYVNGFEIHEVGLRFGSLSGKQLITFHFINAANNTQVYSVQFFLHSFISFVYLVLLQNYHLYNSVEFSV